MLHFRTGQMGALVHTLVHIFALIHFSHCEVFWPNLELFFDDFDPYEPKSWFNFIRKFQFDVITQLQLEKGSRSKGCLRVYEDFHRTAEHFLAAQKRGEGDRKWIHFTNTYRSLILLLCSYVNGENV